MKSENKVPVLDRISGEMKSAMNFYRDDLPPRPAADDLMAQRRHYIHERQLWNAGAPEVNIRGCVVSTAYGPMATRIYSSQPHSLATLYYLHGGDFTLGNPGIHGRIMRLLARYTQCMVIDIDYSLAPEARFPQVIEKIAAICQYSHQHASDYSLNMNHIGFTGDSAGTMLVLASALRLRDKRIVCGKVAGVLLWYGSYGL